MWKGNKNKILSNQCKPNENTFKIMEESIEMIGTFQNTQPPSKCSAGIFAFSCYLTTSFTCCIWLLLILPQMNQHGKDTQARITKDQGFKWILDYNWSIMQLNKNGPIKMDQGQVQCIRIPSSLANCIYGMFLPLLHWCHSHNAAFLCTLMWRTSSIDITYVDKTSWCIFQSHGHMM